MPIQSIRNTIVPLEVKMDDDGTFIFGQRPGYAATGPEEVNGLF